MYRKLQKFLVHQCRTCPFGYQISANFQLYSVWRSLALSTRVRESIGISYQDYGRKQLQDYNLVMYEANGNPVRVVEFETPCC